MHTLLADACWEGADLGDLIRAQLDAQGARARADLTVRDEGVALPPNEALALGLALHELATNAASVTFHKFDDYAARGWPV